MSYYRDIDLEETSLLAIKSSPWETVGLKLSTRLDHTPHQQATLLKLHTTSPSTPKNHSAFC